MKAWSLPQTNQGHRFAVRDEGTCGSAPVPRQPLPCEAFSMGMGFSGEGITELRVLVFRVAGVKAVGLKWLLERVPP